MTIRRAALASLTVLAALAVGCGGDDEDGGDSASGGGSGETLTVWNNEFQPDRMEATQAILDDFTAKTGIKTKQVAVPEDQLPTLMTNAAAAGELPDVVLATPLQQSQQYAAEEIFDSEAAQAVIDNLGADTFSQNAIELVSMDDLATGVPSDGWGQLLIYRSDVFEEAGIDPPQTLDDVRNAAEQLHGKDDMVGITLATAAGDGFTAETFEHIALAFGCQMVNDAGDVTFDSPECVEALRWYGDLASNYSVEGAQDVDSTRGTYFAGRAAMMFWSPFLLDGMAGLRADTKPSCPQCKKNPAFLAENSALVGPLSAAGEPSQFGQVSTFNIGVDAPTEDAQALVEFMMNEGYTRWLALSPQGKYPVRFGDSQDPEKFKTAWTELESGVDKKAPLSQFYSEESIASLGAGVENFQRWGFAQGQGPLMGALGGEQPVANAVADVIGGKDPAEAAKDVQATAEELQAGLQ